MSNTKISVRVRVSQPHAENNTNLSPRDAFWQLVRSDASQTSIKESNVQRLEGKFLREVPRELARLLVNSVAAPITNVAKLLEETNDRYGWQELDLSLRMRQKEERGFSSADLSSALVQLTELRANRLREIPNYQLTLEQVRAASRVHIFAKIIKYSSLEFGLSFGNLEALTKAFDSDFESFQVFLNVFVPRSFENLFLGSNGHGYEWSIQTDSLIEETFATAAKAANLSPTTSTSVTSTPKTSLSQENSSIQKAEWLWRLANGSLLVPVVILLAVLFFTIQEVGKSRSMQAEAMKPVLDYYQQLLLLQKSELKLASESDAAKPPKESPSNTLQGTLRDKAAQRP